jgi:ABC-2 type transport system permease protein
VTVASLFGLAAVLVGRRDVGLGLWPQRRGSARASRGLRSPEGLVWRLQRGALLGWTVGLFGFGLVFGTLSEQIKGLQGDAVEWYAAFGGDADLLGAYWASMMQMGGMVVAVYVVMLLLRLHHDEAEGTLEPVLGAAVSRRRWLGAYALNALAGAVLLTLALAVAMAITGGQVIGGTGTLLRDLFGAALAQLPVVVVLGGAVVTVIAAAPRWAVGVSWALVVGSVAAGPMFGPSLGLPGWLQAMSPFTHIPNVPAVAVSAEPIVSLLAAGLALSALGVFLLRRRDLALPA